MRLQYSGASYLQVLKGLCRVDIAALDQFRTKVRGLVPLTYTQILLGSYEEDIRQFL